MTTEKINYSFYMLADFGEKLDALKLLDDRITALSRSQAVYFLVTELLAEKQKQKESENKPAPKKEKLTFNY